MALVYTMKLIIIVVIFSQCLLLSDARKRRYDFKHVSVSHHPCTRKGRLYNVKSWEKQYKLVKQEVNNSQFIIVKVQHIRNPCIGSKYVYIKRLMKDSRGTANERTLFHGSKVYTRALRGFDERHSSSGSVGTGIYFQKNAAATHKLLKKRKNGTFQMLLCTVLVGKMNVSTQAQHYAHAPVGFDSVLSPDRTEVAVYRGEQAYPLYLITYKVKRQYYRIAKPAPQQKISANPHYDNPLLHFMSQFKKQVLGIP